MTDVLFIQGAGEGTHEEWDNKLVDSLQRELGAEFVVRFPSMPNEDDPKYSAWKPVIEREISSLGERAIVVGHSVGGTMLLNVLAESAQNSSLTAIVLLAAAFIGPEGWPSDEIAFDAGLGARLPAGVPVLLYHGTNDDTVPIEHAALYASLLPQARVHRLDGRDHQLNNDLSEPARAMLSLSASAV